MTVGIYAFFDLDGNCLYVGQSSNLEKRRSQHLKHLRGGYHKRKDFVEWFIANGEDALEFRMLAECSEDVDIKNRLEIEYFQHLSPKFYGQVPSLNNRFSHSDETRLRISTSVRKNLQDLGVYEDRQCICGKYFTAFVKKDTRFCSTKCVGSSRSSSLNYDEVVKLYSSGLSLHKVGDILGVSYRTVHRFMVQNGIPRRKCGTINTTK